MCLFSRVWVSGHAKVTTLYHEMIEGGVIVPDNLEESKIALVYGQMNEPPGARMRIALTGLTLAEQFRDETGSDVLFFVDNIFRFTQAGSEVSALLGRIPSAVGYQPTLGDGHGRDARADYIDKIWFDYICASGLRSCR